MGVSTKHASSVPLVLNVSTGSITPQFHVVFDDWFATVSSEESDLPDFNADEWAKMFGDSTFQYVLDDSEEASSPTDQQDTMKSSNIFDKISSLQELAAPSRPLSVPEPATSSTSPMITTRLHAEGGGSPTTPITPESSSTSIPTHLPVSSHSTNEQLKSSPDSVSSKRNEKVTMSAPERKPTAEPRRSSRNSKEVS